MPHCRSAQPRPAERITTNRARALLATIEATMPELETRAADGSSPDRLTRAK